MKKSNNLGYFNKVVFIFYYFISSSANISLAHETFLTDNTFYIYNSYNLISPKRIRIYTIDNKPQRVR